MNIILMIITIFYAVMIVVGYRKGLVKMVTSVACVLIALLVARITSPAVSRALAQSNEVVDWVRSKVIPNVKGVTVPMVLSALSYVVLFVTAFAIVKIVALFIKKIAGLPVINFFDHIAGGFLGAFETTVFVWVLMLVVSVFQQFDICRTIMAQIWASQFLSVLYQNDPLITIVQNITL